MSETAPGAREREAVATRLREGGKGSAPERLRMVLPNANSNGPETVRYAFVDLGDSARVAIVGAPGGRGPFAEQAGEVFASLQAILQQQAQPMAVTVLTVFLREPGDEAACRQMLTAQFGSKAPVTNFVFQPPCCGAALAIEAWAIGGDSVRVEHFGPHTLAVSYDSVRWVYCAGLSAHPIARAAYDQTTDGLRRMRAALAEAGSSLERVVRTWFYVGDITGTEDHSQRYKEFNRARSDFYRDIHFCNRLPEDDKRRIAYPASTGIGMAGSGLVMSCMALETQREDLRLLPLENPQQTPAYSYHPRYSPESPKFSRAMALLLGNYLTTWVSGTASIVDSESRFPDDIEKQTRQTIDNIEGLIAPENFAAHGVRNAGASLNDLAKIRVYIKREEDFAKCKAVCEQRFGNVPAIYAIADVCRPELLVEIEGVAFSKAGFGTDIEN
jgi:enamine deaminase RidA (YjgF/YER057c/UK114 family)